MILLKMMLDVVIGVLEVDKVADELADMVVKIPNED